ncbi:MAG TPA: hypothetical protein VKW76_01040 [Candidatus Binatia bacterium]|nr:hypothetical protein [Candidatus Binatia bacterium]
MPGVLRIQGELGVRLEEVREHLARLEHAYNSIYAFERIIASAERLAQRGPWPAPLFGLDPFGWPGFPIRTGRLLSSWPPSPAVVASVVPGRDRLVLQAARFESPGFWDFLRSLNPLEVIRQYLNDRHERRRDREYREAAEARRLDLENRLLENRVIRERIDIARSLGAADSDLTPLLNELVHRPLRALNGAQDEGVIESAAITDQNQERK